MSYRVAPWLHWECLRCHREVLVENVDMGERGHFEVRCPLCDLLTRFVKPTGAHNSDGNRVVNRADVQPRETH